MCKLAAFLGLLFVSFVCSCPGAEAPSKDAAVHMTDPQPLESKNQDAPVLTSSVGKAELKKSEKKEEGAEGKKKAKRSSKKADAGPR